MTQRKRGLGPLLVAFVLAGCAGIPGLTAPGGGVGTWTKVPTGLTERITAIDFADVRVGMAVGEKGVILKTVDGGTWQTLRPAALVDKNAVGISVLDANTAYLVTNQSLFRTGDGGQNWTFLNSFVTTKGAGDLTGVKFVDALNGYAWGGSVLYRTVDGGTKWLPQSLGAQAPVVGLRAHATVTWAWAGGGLYRLVEGAGWANVLGAGADEAQSCGTCPSAAAFPGPADYWVLSNTKLFHSVDAGNNWASVPIVDKDGVVNQPNGGRGKSVLEFPDPNNGWLLSGGSLWATADGGRVWANWKNDKKATDATRLEPSQLAALRMLAGNAGWAVGQSGLLMRFAR